MPVTADVLVVNVYLEALCCAEADHRIKGFLCLHSLFFSDVRLRNNHQMLFFNIQNHAISYRYYY